MSSSVNSLKRNPRVNNSFKFIKEPRVKDPSLLVIWNKSDGNIGSRACEFIIKNLNGEIFCDVEPAGFYPLGGVEIENDVGYIPLNRFYSGKKPDLVVFSGYEPQKDYYQFISVILDIVQYYLKVSEIYTLSSYVAPIPYNAQRRMQAVYNEEEFKKRMADYGLVDMDWRGPPAISSYLIWLAKKRKIPAMSLWCEVPFYLSSIDDFKSQKLVFEFFSKRFGVKFDSAKIDGEIEEQSQSLLNLRKMDKEVDSYLGSIELNISLSQDEVLYLTKKIAQHFLKS